jgi:carnitine 3-dehydrogenase
MVKYGPTYQAIWDDLLDARLDAPTIEAVSKSLRVAISDRTDDDLRAERDSGLVEILRSVSRHGAL